jgi:predicted negative regulator of RcsB-dependent stress response
LQSSRSHLNGPACSLFNEGNERRVDTQTRHALRGDKFAQAAKSGVTWVSGHRTGVLRWAVGIGVVVVVALGIWIFADVRSSAAEAALGSALDTYSAPLAIQGAPVEPGVYATAALRAKAANERFVAVAHDYGWLEAGRRAQYFAGITYAELGQNGRAEAELKTVADSWDRNLSNLGKLALAGLYHQTNRDPEAIALYNQIIAKPSVTVSAAVAQLNLADLYAASGKRDMARVLWAKVRDTDKEGAAGSIAAQKLTAQ